MAMEKGSALITGCSSGIGLDAARTLKARGWRVFATCRREEDCARLRAEGLESFRLDYEDEPSIGAAMDEALARTGGRLDALFNNGAYAIPGFIEDLPTAALRQIFEANVFGWHEATRRALAVMRRQDSGRIVQCSSVLGFAGVRWRGSYVATKHAIEGYTDSLRLELRGTGVRVSLIEPGPIETRFNENALAQFQRWIDPAASLRGRELGDIVARYRATDRPRNRFTLPPSAVSAKLVHALESPRPRARYRVTTPTHVVEALRRLAPRSLLDAMLARQ
jgi:NAD(P)-dependent dehydrogenase (short-subunit alcohol dehydrogenase family)